MERLTFMNGDAVWCVDNENCFEEQSEHYCGPAIDRLAYYEDMEEQGRLVILPCKVGDTVWVTAEPWTEKLLKKPLEVEVNAIKKYSHGVFLNLLFDTRKFNGIKDYNITHIGKTILLTREQAEEALKGGAK